MIVAEGMDGSGKSGLVARLAADLKLPVHARACKSTEGPIDELYNWSKRDVRELRWQPFSIYDRHPLVSEFIYGPITRQSVSPQFYTPQGWGLSRQFAKSVLLIFCDPGLDEVLDNVLKGKHMPGVTEHACRLYYGYKTFMHYWPGDRPVVWDYTQPHTYTDIVQRCVEYMGTRKDQPA